MDTIQSGVLQPVKSSNVAALGHDPETGDFYVKWIGGRLSVYSKVPADIAATVIAAKSPGTAVRSILVPTYQHRYATEGAAPAIPASVTGQPLSRDAETIAASYLHMQPAITFNRPHIIHPRMRAALDELTAAGLMTREDDPRGPMTWKATKAMAAAAKVAKPPKKDEGFPFTIKEGEETANG